MDDMKDLRSRGHKGLVTMDNSSLEMIGTTSDHEVKALEAMNSRG